MHMRHSRLGNTQHRVRLLETLKHRLRVYRYIENKRQKTEIEQKKPLLITSVYRFTTKVLQAFHALYIGTLTITTKQ